MPDIHENGYYNKNKITPFIARMRFNGFDSHLHLSLTLDNELTEAQVVSKIAINDDHKTTEGGGKHYPLALWNGHNFEVVYCDIDSGSGGSDYLKWDVEGTQDALEAIMYLYAPIDPKIRVEDVQGARRAYLNDAGTGFLFEHVDADWHHDFEYQVESAVDSLFSRELEVLQETVLSKVYSVVRETNPKSNAASNARSQMQAVRNKLNALTEFKHHVKRACTYFTQQMTLGHVHRNPADSHVHDIVSSTLAQMRKAWVNDTDNGLAPRVGIISTELDRLKKKAEHEHTYLRRWEVPKVFPNQE